MRKSFITLIPAEEKVNYNLIRNWDEFFQNTDAEAVPKGTILKIRKTIFQFDVFIKGVLDVGIEFEDCYFTASLGFYNATLHHEIRLNRCFIDDDLLVTSLDNEFKKNFDIINVTVQHKVIISGGTFQVCHWSFKSEPEVYIHGGAFKELVIGYWGGASISTLTLELGDVKGLIRVVDKKTSIDKLSLMRHALEANVTLQDFSVNYLSIYNYRNEKGLRISNIVPMKGDKPSEFAITEAYLGKAEFYSIDFNLFDIFKIVDAHLVECSFVNIKWATIILALKGRSIYQTEDEKALPEKIQRLESRQYVNIAEKNQLERDIQVVIYYEKKREVLRQLKYALSKQGDVINEQRFHSLEMNAHKRTLKDDKDFWTKWIIQFSYIFSDFGQSISRPIIGLLSIHFCLFFILVVSGVLAPLHFSISHPTFSGFNEGVYQFFRLINPLRKADDTFKGVLILIDLAMRIWSSYMIYNIARASRRFIK